MTSNLGPRPISLFTGDFDNNMILKSDSYKMSHYLMLPPNTTKMCSYIEARGGDFPNTIFFGPQMCLLKYFTTPITNKDIVDAEYFAKVSGLPFNKPGWVRIVNKHGGYIPLEICAVKEGSNIPILNALMTVDSTDSELSWLTTYYEPMLLRSAWYGTTVATLSWTIKQLIKKYMEETCDDLSDLNYKLHDFGSRGVSSGESAGIGGAGHLINFWGSDNMEGAMAAMKYYDCDVPLRSIPASEHSVTTIWGQKHEVDAYRNMLRHFAKPGAKISIVADSYDLMNMIKIMIGDDLKQQIINSEAVIIIRPDSGIPHEMVYKTINALMDIFGFYINHKGYKVLPPYIKVIQGDGIEYDSINQILKHLTNYDISTGNIFLGMGGALLQKVHRDTGQWANKVSAGLINGEWVDVFKHPTTDSNKKSKKGRQMLYKKTFSNDLYKYKYKYKTQSVSAKDPVGWESVLEPIYKNGDILRFQTFDGIRNLVGF